MPDCHFSICIPSYTRSEDLCRAINSCLAQKGDFEILIGDDTPDNSVVNTVAQTFPNHGRIIYHRNKPSLGQAANVNRLFEMAKGEWIVLLHDDDYLEPEALAVFYEQIRLNPSGDLFYGKQHLEEVRGVREFARSEDFNQGYFRTHERQGIVENAKEAVLLSQIPSNGFCIKASVAKASGYPGLPDSDDACDWAFCVQLALRGAAFVFIDDYISTYVLSPKSVARQNPKNNIALRAMQIAERYLGDQMTTPAFGHFFASHVGVAVTQALVHGERKYAFHLARLAWQDERVSRILAVKTWVKCFLPTKVQG